MDERHVRAVNFLPGDFGAAQNLFDQPDTGGFMAPFQSDVISNSFNPESVQLSPGYHSDLTGPLLCRMPPALPVGTVGRGSPTLPSKVYDCRSSVVLVQDLIQ